MSVKKLLFVLLIIVNLQLFANFRYKPTNKEELKELIGDESIYLGDIDTSAITDMSFLFRSVNRKNYEGIEMWNVSNVQDMSHMFEHVSEFNQDISNWDVSKVENMTTMFKRARKFNQPIGKWNVEKVENMSDMFVQAYNFNQDLSSWNVSNVKNMGGMFYAATRFNQNLNNWDVSGVKSMFKMFTQAESFNQPLDNWNVRNVKHFEFMFASSSAFNQNLDKWDSKIKKRILISIIYNKIGIYYRPFYAMFEETELERLENLPEWYTEIPTELKTYPIKMPRY